MLLPVALRHRFRVWRYKLCYLWRRLTWQRMPMCWEPSYWNGENEVVAFGMAHARLLDGEEDLRYVATRNPVMEKDAALFQIHAGYGRSAKLRDRYLKKLVLRSKHYPGNVVASLKSGFMKMDDEILCLGENEPLAETTALKSFAALVKGDKLLLAGVGPARCDCIKDLFKGKVKRPKQSPAADEARGLVYPHRSPRVSKETWYKGTIEMAQAKLSAFQYLIIRPRGYEWSDKKLCDMVKAGMSRGWSLGKTCQLMLANADWQSYQQAAIILVRIKSTTREHEWATEPPWYRRVLTRAWYHEVFTRMFPEVF